MKIAVWENLYVYDIFLFTDSSGELVGSYALTMALLTARSVPVLY